MSEEKDPAPDDFNVGEWLQGTGPDSDIAVCTRVRFARNVLGYRFSTCMTTEEARDLTRYISRELADADFVEELRVMDLDDLEDLERKVLVERHIISREHAQAERSRSVAVNEDESISVMINEEDHIRAQVFLSGYGLAETYKRAERMDEALLSRLPLAFSEEFGFLTSCPTNTGTGMRVSVMLHLPGLVWSEEIEKVSHSAQKLQLAVRGLYGEGSRALGDFYQVSNQVTLGRSEEQIMADVGEAVNRILSWEREVRDALMEGDARTRTLDRIFRSLGNLERARILTSEEALNFLSGVRFGVEKGLISGLTIQKVNRAVLLSQPAHLQRVYHQKLSPAERDERRATLIRKLLDQGHE